MILPNSLKLLLCHEMGIFTLLIIYEKTIFHLMTRHQIYFGNPEISLHVIKYKVKATAVTSKLRKGPPRSVIGQSHPECEIKMP